MRRTTFWLWLSGGILGLATLIVFGGWWAVRQWSEEIGPRLPPSLAYAMLGWGSEEAAAAQTCFGDFSSYWQVHEMTPAMADARNVVLCAELRGSRAQQLTVLDFIRGSNTGFVGASTERDALVYALTTSNDHELRKQARDCWLQDGPTRRTVLRWTLMQEGDDHSLISPDGWVSNQLGVGALQVLFLHNWGYYHNTPKKYRDHLKEMLGRLIAADQRALMADDPRTHALVLLAISEAFAVSYDQDLKPVVQQGLATLLADPVRLERLWLDDTTTAVLTTHVLWAMRATGIYNDELSRHLSIGLTGWMTTADESGIPQWCSRDEPVSASTLERWAAWTVCRHYLQHNLDTPPTPPVGITDPHDSTPFGRILIRIATSIHALSGKPAWLRVFDQRSDVLEGRSILTPDHQIPENTWPATATVSARWETIFALLERSIERYRPPPTNPP